MQATDQITFAIAYDFDGTLSAENMQEYEFIPKLGISAQEFWSETQRLSKAQRADPILSYMYLMLKESNAKNIPIRKEDFAEYGRKIHFFPGIDTWFDRITDYGASLNIKVEHYIISSGLREIIMGCAIANKFKKIYASSYMYDANGVACWPALAINYTTKTQYLFRINKGTLDESDHELVNKYISDAKRPVPFKRMIFIGDGMTDIPSFRLMKAKGGHAIAVYNQQVTNSKEKVRDIACGGNRVNLIFDTDYSAGSPIEHAVKAILEQAAAEYNIFQLECKTKQEFEIKD